MRVCAFKTKNGHRGADILFDDQAVSKKLWRRLRVQLKSITDNGPHNSWQPVR